ncbi:MAG: N-acetylmuramoyl-L-alanine amidase [Pseudomonadota bacterium]
MKNCLLLSIFVLLVGCASGPVVDTRYVSLNHDSRIQYVVLHYTSASLPRSLALLTRGEVSSHYLIGESPPTVYRLVDESRRAWHAGDSEWLGRTWLNSSSIGIELVNPGFTDGPNGRLWHPYASAQIDALILLLKDIVLRYDIPAEHIVGHSDIAPLRKLDPGPLFPWQRLAEAGLGRWPNPQAVADRQGAFEAELPSPVWFQQQLRTLGYACPQTGELDVATRHVLAAFQMRYRPARFDGEADARTAALLAVLNSPE